MKMEGWSSKKSLLIAGLKETNFTDNKTSLLSDMFSQHGYFVVHPSKIISAFQLLASNFDGFFGKTKLFTLNSILSIYVLDKKHTWQVI